MKNEIMISDTKSIDLILYRTKDGGFVVEAIEWETVQGRSGKQGSRILYQEFNDEDSARQFYNETLEKWE